MIKKRILTLISAFVLAVSMLVPTAATTMPIVTMAATECPNDEHEWGPTQIQKISPTQDGCMYRLCVKCGKKEIAMPVPKMDKYTLSQSKFIYDGKAKKPTVTVDNACHDGCDPENYTLIYSNNKNVGTATMKVKFRGECYEGTKTLHFTIIPKGTQIASVSAAKGGFVLKWKKQAAQTTGYQIQYSTSSTFKSGNKTVAVKSPTAVSKKITKLKSKKTYYVRIRTYKNVNGKNYFSKWSKTKSIKTK